MVNLTLLDNQLTFFPFLLQNTLITYSTYNTTQYLLYLQYNKVQYFHLLLRLFTMQGINNPNYFFTLE